MNVMNDNMLLQEVNFSKKTMQKDKYECKDAIGRTNYARCFRFLLSSTVSIASHMA